jgi:hypothetical protein
MKLQSQVYGIWYIQDDIYISALRHNILYIWAIKKHLEYWIIPIDV